NDPVPAFPAVVVAATLVGPPVEALQNDVSAVADVTGPRRGDRRLRYGGDGNGPKKLAKEFHGAVSPGGANHPHPAGSNPGPDVTDQGSPIKGWRGNLGGGEVGPGAA